MHGLLRHLERDGFAGAPRVAGDGFDEQGREVLTFTEGTFVDPRAWSDDQIWHVGRLLRALHGLPSALIDWDTAGPTDRLDEIAATAWRNAQLQLWRWPGEAGQRPG